jgi:hypothetical protein
MRYARLALKLVTGLLWALLVALVSGYIVLCEEYHDGFRDWGRG